MSPCYRLARNAEAYTVNFLNRQDLSVPFKKKMCFLRSKFIQNTSITKAHFNPIYIYIRKASERQRPRPYAFGIIKIVRICLISVLIQNQYHFSV